MIGGKISIKLQKKRKGIFHMCTTNKAMIWSWNDRKLGGAIRAKGVATGNEDSVFGVQQTNRTLCRYQALSGCWGDRSGKLGGLSNRNERGRFTNWLVYLNG